MIRYHRPNDKRKIENKKVKTKCRLVMKWEGRDLSEDSRKTEVTALSILSNRPLRK
jgi:hypothetical protein